jgi:hypothetical protein
MEKKTLHHREEKNDFFSELAPGFFFFTITQLKHHPNNRKSCQKLTALTSN